MPTTAVSPVAGRISDQASNNTIKNAIERTQGAVTQSNKRIASGKIATEYSDKEIADKTRRILNVEQKGMEGEALKSKLSILSGRLNLAGGVNKRLTDIATSVRSRVMNALDPTRRDATFSIFCQNKLTEVENLLNKKDFEGRSLFGGTATLSKTVDLSLAATPAVGASPTTAYNAYFLGEAGQHQTTLQNGEKFDYGASALDPGMRDLIFWLKSGTTVIPDGNPTSDNTKRLQGMQDGLGKTVDGLTDTKRLVGTQLERLEKLSYRNDDDMAYLQTTQSELTDADLLQEFIRSSQETLKLNLNQTLLARGNKNLEELLRNI